MGRSRAIFYGWLVVAACFAVTLTLGATWWSFGVFVEPLESDFGWSRSLVSSAYTSFQIGFAISVILVGRLVDRYSPRPILLASAVLVGLGALVSQVTDISQMRLLLLIVGLGAGATFLVPSYIVQHWFYGRKNAGLALGTVVSGIGFGALLFVPLTNYLVLSHGWRNAYLILSILLFAVIAIASLVTKRIPTESGDRSVGEGNNQEAVRGTGWPAVRAMTSPSFIAMTFAASSGILGSQVVSAHLVPHATGVGISATTSAAAVGLMGVLSVPGRVVSGVISDRIGWKKTLAISLVGMGLSVPWLLFLDATWMLYVFILLYGTCHGMRIPAGIGIVGQYFGMDSFGELIGTSLAIGFVVGAFGPFLAGVIFDRTHDYFIAFTMMMVLLLLAGLAIVLMAKPATDTEW